MIIYLHFLNVKNASAVIIAINNDEKVRLVVEAIKSMDKNIKVVVKISHKAQMHELVELGVKSFINENEIVASKLISKATVCKI